MADFSPEQNGIPAVRREAWRALLDAHAGLIARVEEALAADDLPPLSWYDVLRALHGAEDRALRPRDLGAAVTITRSGLTRLLDRIEAAGLVERRSCPTDRRGSWVVLTDAGERTLRQMSPVYDGELEVSFAGLISDEEAGALSDILGRLGGCESSSTD